MLRNGELLTAVEKQFDVFVTNDQNLRFQQNLADRPLGILVLPTNDWPTLRAMEARIIAAAASLKPGTVIVLPLTN